MEGGRESFLTHIRNRHLNDGTLSTEGATSSRSGWSSRTPGRIPVEEKAKNESGTSIRGRVQKRGITRERILRSFDVYCEL